MQYVDCVPRSVPEEQREKCEDHLPINALTFCRAKENVPERIIVSLSFISWYYLNFHLRARSVQNKDMF